MSIQSINSSPYYNNTPDNVPSADSTPDIGTDAGTDSSAVQAAPTGISDDNLNSDTKTNEKRISSRTKKPGKAQHRLVAPFEAAFAYIANRYRRQYHRQPPQPLPPPVPRATAQPGEHATAPETFIARINEWLRLLPSDQQFSLSARYIPRIDLTDAAGDPLSGPE